MWYHGPVNLITADVAIVGAGLAGLVAAIEARSHGADALVLDKLPDPARWNAVGPLPGGVGNDTWRSGGGGLTRFESDVLVQHLSGGSDELAAGRDPADVLLERHLERGEGEINVELLRTYCHRIFEDCRWLRDEIGLQFDEGGRTVKDVGIGLFKWLHKTAMERGVRMMFSTCVESLVVDSTGTVSGVRASTDGAIFEVAARAVILATGGFQGNRDMLARYVGRALSEDVMTVGSPDNTGDGHRMAIEAGAAMRHLDVCHVRTTDNFFGQGPSRYLLHIYPMGIYFNRNFERFLDEGVEDSDTIANAIALQPGAIAGLIFDDKARQRFSKEYDAYPRREQLICTAGSIPELAEKMRVAPDGLGRLVDAFNASVKDGSAAGPNLPKSRSALRIDTPPFHGFYPVRPALNHTLGGVVVDGASSQVVDANGRRIAGLFAAGTVVNWANGRSLEFDGIKSYKGSYHAGASSGAGVALVSGRLAAQHAVGNLIGA
jgi:succinate dehydrogenase/fumarate reductase flavoprotein subunit